MEKTSYRIKENSWLAKLAAKKLGTRNMAFVLGNTIFLHNSTAKDFLENTAWFKHELCHVRQFRQHGFFLFIVKYLWESIRKGYHLNKYEIEARNAESA